MNRYYWNGNRVSALAAECVFYGAYKNADRAEVQSMWAQCQSDESARDEWLPAEIEIVEGE